MSKPQVCFDLSLRHGSALVYRDGMGVLASLTILTFNLLPISILTTPNENWGRKVGVIKMLCVYDNGKGVKIV